MITDPSIPVGGSTGHSHEHSASIDNAVEWLCSVPTLRRPRPIVPHLRSTFGLSAQQAIEALRESNLRLARAI